MPATPPDVIDSFISRWENSGAAERANYQMFLSELCEILGVPRPDPTSPDPAKNLYVFDRAITRINPDGSSTTNYIDFYNARHFVLETKQGTSVDASPDELAKPTPTKTGHGKRGSAAFDRALERAFHQGRGYITSLPVAEGRPPFLLVCDVGHSIDLYAEFSGTGGHYERFPDPKNHRILLTDLRHEETRARLRSIWTDPHSLDPSRKAAEVTRDIAGRLAKLAKSLETDQHDPRVIAGFLQRCLFTMFAEDIGLLPEDGFKKLLAQVKQSPHGFPVLISALWKEMATGTHYSALLFQEIACFNGGLFENTTALPLSKAQLAMLNDAAGTDWSAVEPSIFGTLLTRALDPRERHKLGAQYTPRSYVERLIRPTIIEPLRDEWDAVRIAAANLQREADAADDHAAEKDAAAKNLLSSGNSAAAKDAGAGAAKLRAEAKKKDAEALKLVTEFHRHLCAIRVLDPACGTANFLYVTLEHLKRLEAEVLEMVAALGGDATFEMHEYKVRPEQFLGLEISPNAVAIAQLVLWIGYFQWQRKTTGKADTGDRPLLRNENSIRQQDAVLTYDEKIPRRDPVSGEILTIWNGYTTKPHPVTGKEVPDESATIALFDYINPRRANWPQANYIVGNPPFIGASRMRDTLGDGYTEALRKAWKGAVPESADFVMFWWQMAAEQVVSGRCRRFGFITTNSIHQTFNRRVLEPFVAAVSNRQAPLHLAYAIPDHPWVDAADGAAVRIAMTVAAPGIAEGILEKVITETAREDGENEVVMVKVGGTLAANLQIGADLTSCGPLQANSKISCPGVKLHGSGFIVTHDEALRLGLGTIPGIEQHIRGYRNGKDLTDTPREALVIDLFGLDEDEVKNFFPSLYQHVFTTVKPARDQNKREAYRTDWWIFGEPRSNFRPALEGLSRYIATVETSKHRFFTFLDQSILPDNRLICFALDGAYDLAILSSNIHIIWALAAGGKLEDRPVYNKSRCFEPFPFPALEEGELKQRIRDLGERLDAHRKRQQAQHSGLTLTGVYNVLEKLRSGAPLTAKDKLIHEQGLVTVLQQIHDELDAAVLEAYGWSDLSACSGGLRPSHDTRGSAVRDSPPNGIDGPRPPLQYASVASSNLSISASQHFSVYQDALLTRLVALNHARAAEEQQGLIHWLRPDYQNCSGGLRPSHDSREAASSCAFGDGHRPPLQCDLSLPTESHGGPGRSALPAWPDRLPDQVALIRKLIGTHDKSVVAPYDAEALSARFGRKNKKRTEQIEGILETLKGLGQL